MHFPSGTGNIGMFSSSICWAQYKRLIIFIVRKLLCLFQNGRNAETQLSALFHSIPLANKKMLYLKTVTLNNEPNRSPISDLLNVLYQSYTILSWLFAFLEVCFLMFADLLFNFQSFLASMNFIKRFWLNRYYNVSSSFNTVLIRWALFVQCHSSLKKCDVPFPFLKIFFIHFSGLKKV